MSPQSAARPDVPILVCCASRDRPESLRRTVDSFCATSTRADMAVFVDSDQINQYLDAYDWEAVTSGRVLFHVGTRVGPNASINTLYQKYRDQYCIFGVTPDDSRFVRRGWDDFVIENVAKFPAGIGVVSPSHSDGEYCAYPYVSRAWLDIVGFYAFPEAHSFVWDTCIELLGEATNIIRAPSDVFYMEHDCKASENFDEYLRVDEHAFLSWCAVSRAGIVKRLKAAMQSALFPTGSEHGPYAYCRRCGAVQ